MRPISKFEKICYFKRFSDVGGGCYAIAVAVAVDCMLRMCSEAAGARVFIFTGSAIAVIEVYISKSQKTVA
jgi:hypothetical protein